MSSKVLRGDMADSAQPIQWARKGSVSPPVARTQVPGANRVTRQVDEEPSPAVDMRVAEARKAGRAEGEQSARNAMQEQVGKTIAQYAAAVAQLTGIKAQLRKEAEQDILKLAVAIARKVLHRELAIDPEALLGLVKVALEKIDAREMHCVRVHPTHVESMKRALTAAGVTRQIEVHGDASLESGAAVFECSRGFLDTSVETQLREIERGLVALIR